MKYKLKGLSSDVNQMGANMKFSAYLEEVIKEIDKNRVFTRKNGKQFLSVHPEKVKQIILDKKYVEEMK